MFHLLPIELKSKIMFSGYIVHPVANIIKELIRNYHLREILIEDNKLIIVDLNFYECLSITYLRNVCHIFWI